MARLTSRPALACNFFLVLSISAAGQSAPTLGVVENAASYDGVDAPITPGEIVTLFGSALGPAAPVPLALDSAGHVATVLGGVQVLFNAVPAPLLYVSANQISAVVPFGVSGLSAKVQVVRDGAGSNTVVKPVLPAVPGIFTADASGKGQALAANVDGALNSTERPAAPGSTVTFYVSGAGQTRPPSADGLVASAAGALALPVAVSVGGRTAQASYAGPAPSSVEGLTQVNVVIPTDLPGGGNLPLLLMIGGRSTQTGVTLAISGPPSPPAKTIFVIHGLGQGSGSIRALAASLSGPLGVDPNRFIVDAGFDFSECADNIPCSSRCSISGGAQKLARYIVTAHPSGDVIFVAVSLGGLIVRDLMVNKWEGALDGHKVAALVTLGTPNAGYPNTFFDGFGFCKPVVDEMNGNWRVPNPPGLSSYLSSLNSKWNMAGGANLAGLWLAASGRSCGNPQRTIDPSTGCRNQNPYSDGIVCDDSAVYAVNAPADVKPTELWQDPERMYVHTSGGLGGFGSVFILCGNSGQNPSLSNPPAFGELFARIRAAINGLPVRPAMSTDASSILTATEAQQAAYVQSALAQGLPPESGESMALLVLNRSAAVIPLLEQRLAEEIRLGRGESELVNRASEMIAYGGNAVALRALGRLAALDPPRMLPLVGRTLDHALSRGDLSTLLSQPDLLRDPLLRKLIVAWSRSLMNGGSFQNSENKAR